MMNLVWGRSRHKGSELLVLLAIADNANEETGVAWPSQKLLAAKTRLSRRGVQLIIPKLLAGGEVEIAKQGNRSRATEYRLRAQTLRSNPLVLANDKAQSDPDLGRSQSAHELEGNRKDKNLSAADPPKVERKDEIFEALAEAMEIPLDQVPKGKTGRGPWQAAARDLKAESATREQILAVARHYRKTWPTMTLTVTALAKHFAQMRAEHMRKTPRPPCPDCGVGGGMHLAECPQAAAA